MAHSGGSVSGGGQSGVSKCGDFLRAEGLGAGGHGSACARFLRRVPLLAFPATEGICQYGGDVFCGAEKRAVHRRQSDRHGGFVGEQRGR